MDTKVPYALFNDLLKILDEGNHEHECPLRCVTSDCEHDHFCNVCEGWAKLDD